MLLRLSTGTVAAVGTAVAAVVAHHNVAVQVGVPFVAEVGQTVAVAVVREEDLAVAA